jgi:hypothetical protein
MDERNPYAPPMADVRDVMDVASRPEDYTFVESGQSRPIGNGAEWIAASWQIFRRNPWLWILAFIVGYGTMIALAFVPMVNLLLRLVSPLMLGGFAAMGEASRRGTLSGLTPLFTGFRKQTASLLTLGVMSAVLLTLPLLVFAAVDGPSWVRLALGYRDPAMFEGRLLLMFGYLTMTSILGCLIVFAPPLVLLDGLSPLAALRASASGAVKNLLPGILCTLLFAVLFVASLIPLALGLFVTVPMMLIVFYVAYHDIFHAPAASAT